MMATDVTGLVIDAIWKIALAGIGTLFATSNFPAAPSYSTPSRLTTISTTPGVSPRLTASSICFERAALPASENPCTLVRSLVLRASSAADGRCAGSAVEMTATTAAIFSSLIAARVYTQKGSHERRES